jgi:hypothetical protein
MKRTTLIALILLVVLVGVAYILTEIPLPEIVTATNTPEPTPYLLVNLEENSISEVEITSAQGKVTIGRDNQGLWILKEPENPSIDLGTLEMRITDLINLRARQIITSNLTDEEIGLNTPTMTAIIMTKDGVEHTYRVGGQNPTGSGYYARGSDNQIVLLNLAAVENVLQLISSSYATSTPSPEFVGTASP